MTPRRLRTLSAAAALFAATLGHAALAQTAAPDAPAPATTQPMTPTAPDATTATPTAPGDNTQIMPMQPTAAAPPMTAAIPPAPEPAEHHSSKFRIGPEVGVYLPTSSKTRDRFGSSWPSIGLGFGAIDPVKSAGQLGFDLSLQYQKHNGNRVFLLPVGLGYRIALSKEPGMKTVPYAGVSGDIIFADIRSVPDNVHSGFRTGEGGSVLLGVNFGDNGNLEARYQVTSRIKGFDFSGLDLTAGFRF